MPRFEGKVALVTGAGSGIGRAVAQRLASEGASVFAVDIDRERLDKLRQRAEGDVETHHGDLSDPAVCADVVAACVARYGRLDVLGNVAGIYFASHATAVTVEQYRRLMAVNADACFFLAQAALPHLLAAEGNIVNIASNSGLQGVAYSVVYCMSKGAVVQLTRALAVEYLKQPIRVNAIAPGGVMTNLAAGVTFPADIDADLAARMAGLRGLAKPEEVAALFAFLASDEAASITGAIYTLDNGLTAS